MSVLQVIDQGFRTTNEEQDDTILWLVQSMRSAGADVDVLLSGHGVHYSVLSKAQPALSFGQWQQSQPAELPKDINNLIASGVKVYVVKEDLAERGLSDLPQIEGTSLISRSNLAGLYQASEQVWHW